MAESQGETSVETSGTSVCPAVSSSSDSCSEEGTPVRSDSSLTVAPVSILDRLRAPKRADISRKRKLRTNLPPVGKRRSTTCSLSDPKSTTPLQCVKEFPDESLTTSSGKLFCTAGRECLSLKLSIITNHVKSVKHSQGKKLKKREARERDIVQALKKHNTDAHLEGETLPIEQQVHRVKVISVF